MLYHDGLDYSETASMMMGYRNILSTCKTLRLFGKNEYHVGIAGDVAKPAAIG